ncbi:uncharacterized protein LOC106011870 [Aplysia californica]|uniref:Uncharacterized protein LOC106011870 n=1 Tax=Aplysia californica TaxID=6500 RepID=A0ABM1A0N9_APLCA|nr:uncharacterized protein LOC106011870 [Aplysia californica]
MKLVAVFLALVVLGVCSAKSLSNYDLKQVVRALEKKAQEAPQQQGGGGGEGEGPTLDEKIDKLMDMVEFLHIEPFLTMTREALGSLQAVCPPVLYYAARHEEEEEGEKEKVEVSELRRALARLTRGEGEGEGGKGKPEKEGVEEEEDLMWGGVNWPLVHRLCLAMHGGEGEESGGKSGEEGKGREM